MRLYLDDDSVRSVLIRRLAAEGHDVLIPSDAGIAGEEDATHLMCSIRTDRILVTHNHDDFELLHNLVVLAGGHHPGILVIRRDS
jgi:predicted nuclease of predicted toxin-antitoxin system